MAKRPNGDGAEEQEQAKKLVPLRPDRCFCAEQRTQALLVYANADTEREDIGKPEMWPALVNMLQPFSTGWVIAEDEAWAVEFMVRSNLPGRCSVVVLRSVDLPAFDRASRRTLPKDHHVAYGGSVDGWIASRKNPDGTISILGKGKDHPEWGSEEDVNRWVIDHASVRQSPAGARRFS